MSGRRKRAVDGPSGPSDEALAEAFYGGDDDAFEEIDRRYRHKLYLLSFTFGLGHHDAQGRVQDTLVKFFETRGKKEVGAAGWFDPRLAKFSTWLYRIHYNNCIDLIRRRGSAPVPFEQADAAEDDGQPSPVELIPARELSPDELLVQTETARIVREAVASLPAAMRVVIELYYFVAEYDEGLTQQHIANVVGCSTPTVNRLLKKGRTLLRQVLVEKGLAEAGTEAIDGVAPRRIGNA
jgi:RNA polymerase sigma-70 factor (ECF subfamily)